MTRGTSRSSGSRPRSELARFLHAHREAEGITREQLAERLGVPLNVVARWEHGTNPNAPHFRRIVEYFDLPAERAVTFLTFLDENIAELDEWARYIRGRRFFAGLGLVEAADRLGVDSRSVTHWENGRGLPTPGRLPHIAELLGIPLAELVARYPGELAIPGPRQGDRPRKATHETMAIWAADYAAAFEPRKTHARLAEQWNCSRHEVSLRLVSLRRHGYLEMPGRGKR